MSKTKSKRISVFLNSLLAKVGETDASLRVHPTARIQRSGDLSANGAEHSSPGQRPGYPSPLHRTLSRSEAKTASRRLPEGRARRGNGRHNRCVAPSGLGMFWPSIPERCPGLVCCRAFGPERICGCGSPWRKKGGTRSRFALIHGRRLSKVPVGVSLGHN